MADLTGQTLGKYQLVERLGRGGMADVYKGFQPGLDRYVAVKVMHSHLSEDSDFITRFQREAKSVANLRHKHIVQVFDFDIQDDHYYMVMEYVENGRTLKEILHENALQNTRLTSAVGLDIGAKLADALDYAHQQGMIHRDIKPSNVLVPSLSNPVLGDFGIARLMGLTGLTGSGAMIGTPAYMSPEQGRGEVADERSDIYALGIILYEMLAGKPPYDADTPYAVILKHINDPLIPPRTLVDTLPETAERIVLKCLAKNPNDRYANAGDMRDALRAVVNQIEDDTEVGKRTPSDMTRPGQHDDASTLVAEPADDETVAVADVTAPARPARKSRAGLYIGGGLVVVAAIAVALAFGLGLVGGGSAASDDGADTGGDTLAESDDEEPEVSLPVSDNPFVQEGRDWLMEGNNERASVSFQQALSQEPDDPQALAGMALMDLHEGNSHAAAIKLVEAIEAAPGDPFVNYVNGILYWWGDGYWNPDRAFESFSKTIDTCGDDQWLCMEGYAFRAETEFWSSERYDIEGALADMEQAILLAPTGWNAGRQHERRGYIHYYFNGDAESAYADYEAGYEANGGEAWVLENAAGVAVNEGDYGRALDYYGRLLTDTSGDPYFMVGRAYIEWSSGDSATAKSSAERALELGGNPLGAHYMLGLIALENDQPGEALDQFEVVSRQPDRWEYDYPFFRPEFGHMIYYDMARVQVRLGNDDEALHLIQQALDEDGWWPEPYILRAEIYISRDNLSAARDSYSEALNIARDQGKEDLIPVIEEALLELVG